MIRTCKNNVKVGSGHFVVVLGAHVRVLTPINIFSLKCKLCMNIINVYFGESEMFFDIHVKMAFVLTPNV